MTFKLKKQKSDPKVRKSVGSNKSAAVSYATNMKTYSENI